MKCQQTCCLSLKVLLDDCKYLSVWLTTLSTSSQSNVQYHFPKGTNTATFLQQKYVGLSKMPIYSKSTILWILRIVKTGETHAFQWPMTELLRAFSFWYRDISTTFSVYSLSKYSIYYFIIWLDKTTLFFTATDL